MRISKKFLYICKNCYMEKEKTESELAKRRLDITSNYVQLHYSLTDNDMCILESYGKPTQYVPMAIMIGKFMENPSVKIYGIIECKITNKETNSSIPIRTKYDDIREIKKDTRKRLILQQIERLENELKNI